ncbi:MAG: hypothetical protein GY803_14705 [Chloroflexi bacterium]|nr:hypothetical protein [Chloroflexota bacterium]
MTQQGVQKDELLAGLPPEWPTSLLPEIQMALAANGRSLVVLDDDPTGTQTVTDMPVLTEWSVESLCSELKASPTFYILTNSRSLPESEAVALNREIGRNLLAASERVKRPFSVVSRSDSTLRGHFPAECDALTDVFQARFDGWLLIPYFLEGGRLTIDDVHYVQEGERLAPASETPFAQDGAFGYRASNLREWVVEKTNGRFHPNDIHAISLNDIRQGGAAQIERQLSQIHNGQIVIVNAVTMRDLEVFTLGLLQAEAKGKNFLYRTAASFVQVRAGQAPSSLLTAEQLQLPKVGGGLIVAGSYVPKTTQQLELLLQETAVCPVEARVEALLGDASQVVEIGRVVGLVDAALTAGQDVVVYTSRRLVVGENGRSGLEIGKRISDSLVQIVQGIGTRPRYLVAKGGITSSDTATKALGVRRAIVAGQILPGVPVWQLGAGSRFPNLPYVVFPGNVGDADALATLVLRLQAR